MTNPTSGDNILQPNPIPPPKPPKPKDPYKDYYIINKECPYCGADFLLLPKKIKQHTDKRYFCEICQKRIR